MNQAQPTPIERLLSTWEARSAQAFPSDAMLINRHIRELREATQCAPSPTAGMNMAQRILHVGGRNPPGSTYVEFGSIQAVEALAHQVLRDMGAPATQPENHNEQHLEMVKARAAGGVP